MCFDNQIAVSSSWLIDVGCLEAEQPSLAEKLLLMRQPMLLFWDRAAFATALFLLAGARPLGIVSGFHSFCRISTLLVYYSKASRYGDDVIAVVDEVGMGADILSVVIVIRQRKEP